MTLLHATHATPSTKRYTVRTAPCSICGAPVEYTTHPAKYCASCHPNPLGREYFRRYAYLRRKLPVRVHEFTEAGSQVEMVFARPGFCKVCGCIRLSAANVDGVCDGCKEE